MISWTRIRGIQRGIRVLEHELNIPAQLAELASPDRVQVGAVEDHLTAGRSLEADAHTAERGLAAAGLADQSERLATTDGEVDVADRVQRSESGA